MSNKFSQEKTLVIQKLKLIAKKLYMPYPAFSRFCQIDYVLRNKHLIPSKTELEEEMAKEKVKCQKKYPSLSLETKEVSDVNKNR